MVDIGKKEFQNQYFDQIVLPVQGRIKKDTLLLLFVSNPSHVLPKLLHDVLPHWGSFTCSRMIPM